VLPMIVVAIQIFFFGSSDSLQHLGGAGRGTTLGSLPSDDNAGQGGKGGGALRNIQVSATPHIVLKNARLRRVKCLPKGHYRSVGRRCGDEENQ
jgi:hypothetical protein